MSRILLVFAFAAVVAPVWAGAPARIPSPIERAVHAPVVVVGKVTTIEKETVDATPYPGAKNKVAYKVAVVKVETNLAGADGVTHLKVGFVPPAKPDPKAERPVRPDWRPDFREGQELLFFLEKHPDGGFYAFSYFTPPVDSKAADYKAQVEAVTKALATVADPMKALKAEKADDRFNAAVVLIAKHRTAPIGLAERETEDVPIAADENKLILKAIAEADWKPDPKGVRLNGFMAVYLLRIGEADGWKAPAGKPGEEYSETTRKAFAAWLDGPGKDYRIKKIVPKKAEK
jgi:hypothetical protein